jgi:hypothetical protein
LLPHPFAAVSPKLAVATHAVTDTAPSVVVMMASDVAVAVVACFDYEEDVQPKTRFVWPPRQKSKKTLLMKRKMWMKPLLLDGFDIGGCWGVCRSGGCDILRRGGNQRHRRFESRVGVDDDGLVLHDVVVVVVVVVGIGIGIGIVGYGGGGGDSTDSGKLAAEQKKGDDSTLRAKRGGGEKDEQEKRVVIKN